MRELYRTPTPIPDLQPGGYDLNLTPSLIYEPYALLHQWGNPGNEPLIFLVFNINPEGVAAVLSGAPAKKQ